MPGDPNKVRQELFLTLVRNQLDRLVFARLDGPLEQADEWAYVELCRQEEELLGRRA